MATNTKSSKTTKSAKPASRPAKARPKARSRPPKGVARRDDGTQVCAWGEGQPDYAAYHDTEWGVPLVGDTELFERICLEGFQSGLSWLTVLRKRENFRKAFKGFDPAKVAKFGAVDVKRLLGDAGIIRNRAKIEATIANAVAARAMIAEGGAGALGEFFWSYRPKPAARPKKMTQAALMKLSQTPESVALSKALKKGGWKFVGPTTCYALMQAVGIVNDHLEGCFRRTELDKLPRPKPRK